MESETTHLLVAKSADDFGLLQEWVRGQPSVRLVKVLHRIRTIFVATENEALLKQIEDKAVWSRNGTMHGP